MILTILVVRIIIAIALPALSTKFLIKNRKELKNKAIVERHGALFLHLKIKDKDLPLWNLFLYCAQRVILVFSCLLIHSAQLFVIVFFMVTSLGIICWILDSRPYFNPDLDMNKLE